jgi:hypothetical protein
MQANSRSARGKQATTGATTSQAQTEALARNCDACGSLQLCTCKQPRFVPLCVCLQSWQGLAKPWMAEGSAGIKVMLPTGNVYISHHKHSLTLSIDETCMCKHAGQASNI